MSSPPWCELRRHDMRPDAKPPAAEPGDAERLLLVGDHAMIAIACESYDLVSLDIGLLRRYGLSIQRLLLGCGPGPY